MAQSDLVREVERALDNYGINYSWEGANVRSSASRPGRDANPEPKEIKVTFTVYK